jgi:hypothetical protein
MAGNLVLVPDADWRLVDGDKKCRQLRCHNRAVAELNRARGSGFRWWAYCPEHMYGRVVVNGVVMIEVPENSPAAEKGLFRLR